MDQGTRKGFYHTEEEKEVTLTNMIYKNRIAKRGKNIGCHSVGGL